MSVNSERQQVFDGLAIAASTLCLIHCLLPPLLLLILPTLAVSFAFSDEFHIAALAFAVPTSAIALLLGFRRHRRALPGLILLPGMTLLAVGALAFEGWRETILTVAGSTLFAIGHVLNWQACPSATTASP